MVKNRLTGIVLVLTIIFSILLPLCSVTYAEVVTTDGFAMATFGEKDVLEKIRIVESSSTDLIGTAGGETGRLLSATDTSNLYILCDVDDKFLNSIPNDVPIDITVEYFDAKDGSLGLAYDSYNPNKGYGANLTVKGAEPLYFEGTETWRTHTWTLEDMKMSNGISGNADFRLGSWDLYMKYSKVDVLVKSVKVNFGKYKNPTNISVQSEKIGNIFSDRDKNITLDIDVHNKTYEPVQGEYSVRIYDKFTNLEVHTEKFELGIDARTDNKYTFSFPNPGQKSIYIVDINETLWTIGKEEDKVNSNTISEFSVAMLSEEGEGNPFYGCMQNIVRPGKGDPYLTYKQQAKVGAKWQREDTVWRDTETEKGKYALKEGAKETWQRAKDEGLEIIMLCQGANPLYDGGKTPASDEAIAAFAKYCAFMAKELKGIVNYYEIWNEWNIVNFNSSNEPPETYAKLCKAAYTAIKEVNPEAVVIGVSTATVDIPWTRRVFEAGAYDYMDMVSVHPYDFSGKFREETFINEGLELVNLMKEYGELKPICYSEMGFSTHTGTTDQFPNYVGFSETAQASAKILANALMRAYHMVDVLIEFEFHDENNQKDVESCWGLVHHWIPGTPGKPISGAKESYLSTAAMNRMWGANTESKGLISKNRAYAVNFFNNKDNRNILVLGTGAGEQVLNIDLGINAVDLYDMYGNKMSTLYSDNGVYSFGVSMTPYYAVGKFGKFEESTKPGAIVADAVTKIGTASDIISFNLTKRINKELVVEIGEIDGATVIENNGFIGNNATIKLETDAQAMGNKLVPITVKDTSGRIYYYAQHGISVTEPITVSISSQCVSRVNNNHWAAKVTIHNNSQMGRHSGVVRLTEPLEMAETARERRFANLAPGKDATFFFNLPVRITKKPTDVMVDVKLDSGLEYTAGEQLIFNTVKYAKTKPVIDGIETSDEWNKDWFGVDEQKNVKLITDWQGPEDLSFNATLMWDEENVYMLAVVQDSIHSVTYSPIGPNQIWRGDSIQFSIDDREVIPVAQEREFTELGIAELPTGGCEAYRWNALYDGLSSGVVIENADVAVKHNDGITIYELRLPWSEIFYEGYKVDPDGTYRFSALINDNDGAGRRGWIEYMSGIGQEKNAGFFGEIILEKK